MSQPVDAAAASAAYQNALQVIGAVEPTVAGAIRSELADQRASLKLIASENYASPAVLLTMGTWLSDKYAEGTIGHRFYAGCQNIDTVEQAAADHARALFGAPHAYVQPHSGIDANLVAFWAILAQRIESPALADGRRQARQRPVRGRLAGRCARDLGNQRALGMSLDAGGHLTHGFRPNISGKMFHQSLLRHRPRDRPARLRRGPRAGPRVPAAGADRRLLRLSRARSTSRRCARSPTRSARC